MVENMGFVLFLFWAAYFVGSILSFLYDLFDHNYFFWYTIGAIILGLGLKLISGGCLST